MKIFYKPINKVITTLIFGLIIFVSCATTAYLFIWIENNIINDVYSLPALWFVAIVGLMLLVAIVICLSVMQKTKSITEISFFGGFEAFSPNSIKSYLSMLKLGFAGGLFYFAIINLHYLLYAK